MIVDAVVLRKFRAACISEITVEIAAFLPCSLMRETEYNGGRFGCFTAGDVKRSRSILSAVKRSTAEIQRSQTVKCLFAMRPSGQAAKMTVKIS